MKRLSFFKWLGITLTVLGILWNLFGMLYGGLPAGSAVGWVAFCLGLFYLWRSRSGKVGQGSDGPR